MQECVIGSPPSRRRGLKNILDVRKILILIVASFAEAWIENPIILFYLFVVFVASFAEAWIEKYIEPTG